MNILAGVLTSLAMSVSPPFLAVGQYQAASSAGVVTIYSCTLGTTPSCSSSSPYTISGTSGANFGYSVSAVNGILALSAPAQSTGGTCFFLMISLYILFFNRGLDLPMHGVQFVQCKLVHSWQLCFDQYAFRFLTVF